MTGDILCDQPSLLVYSVFARRSWIRLNRRLRGIRAYISAISNAVEPSPQITLLLLYTVISEYYNS